MHGRSAADIMLEGDGHDHGQQRHEKLRILGSPLVRRADRLGRRGQTGSPSWRPFEDGHKPTLLEIFYDLFFSASYNVFSDTQKVTDDAKFKVSIGYFCLLWLTWFQVALYDVRYATDSIFDLCQASTFLIKADTPARATRAIQLGVLVGFVVVAPKFNPNDQDLNTMRAMSLILCISRTCLAIEYASTLWHVRRYKKARTPLCLQIALHAAASAVYLGITFRFTREKQSRVYRTWYFIAGAEALVSILLSNLSSAVSLTKTHIMKRLTLLTVMIMGEGIEQLAKEVVTIVRNPDAWDSTTVGLVTAGATTIYLVLLVYFDWLRSSFHLPRLRQQLWTCLHLPFHLALVLFMQAFTQYLLWSKIINQEKRLVDIADPNDDARMLTSAGVRDSLNASVRAFFQDYPPKISSTFETVNYALNNITTISDSFWPLVENGSVPANWSLAPPGHAQDLATLGSTFLALLYSMSNALFGAFGIDSENDVSKKNPEAADEVKDGGYQMLVQDKTMNRYRLVFAYGYIAGGCTIVLMVALSIIVRNTPSTPWPLARLAIILLLGLGTGLVATLWYNENGLEAFLSSPWVMPALTFVWAVILILTHTNGRGIKRCKRRSRRRRIITSSPEEAAVAMAPSPH
ncbi:uncharacterized protein MAM_01157 [Metarhizium album ARSEF 1941]|uniref:Low temperature requirement A n=1 Tax=Metarhizium album (strain ARSEF 1941) TaxID=1081103 RepID=A0A0B2X2A1_METAS|nr:uncharacterized protein MAM_01157 [Metarhizium album ARSEF 1941]KHO00379.1 hypothetical protein MAM_01157 [Metarhizium album ARSEF 1941]